MCGFYCIISNNKIDLESSKKSLNLIKHWGPDSQKYYLNEKQNIFFGFNRLSILDLSKKADQPMNDEESKRIIVFNGEIYNHAEIRKFLISKNYAFKTTSDTEVILKAYDHWGDDFIKKLEGMFSFVIFDSLKNYIFFARDRTGEKPLYYSSNFTNFYISSEIKPIHKDSNITNISKDALNHYFEIGYTPSHTSMLEGIKKLQPGHMAKLDLDSFKLKITKYWEIEKKISKQPKIEKKKIITS